MDGINIDDITIEQYLRLTKENQTPSMVRKIDDMAITEYIEYEERMKRQYSRNSGSYFPTYSGHCTSSNNTTISASEADLKKLSEAMEDTINNDSFISNLPYQPSLEELNPGSFLLLFTIDNYNSYAMANIDASNNFMPRSIYEYLNFDVEEEYTKEIRNQYSRRFDEYKQVFDNEVEQLSNEYTLRIEKKGYVLDDVWEK
ncbi:hypothetical protein Tco_0111216 [Tanacetum coccineum]